MPQRQLQRRNRGRRRWGENKLCEIVAPWRPLQPEHLCLYLFHKWELCRKVFLCKWLEHIGNYWITWYWYLRKIFCQESFPPHFFWFSSLHFHEDTEGAFDWHLELAHSAGITGRFCLCTVSSAVFWITWNRVGWV